jgi:NTP pyrophosphatase (non-canonical NTP hydrolase)
MPEALATQPVDDTLIIKKNLTRDDVLEMVTHAMGHAYWKHGYEKWGRHEFYGILKEEVDELWDAIKADEDTIKIRREALQVIQVCIRYLETGDRYVK